MKITDEKFTNLAEKLAGKSQYTTTDVDRAKILLVRNRYVTVNTNGVFIENSGKVLFEMYNISID